ncbi:hypothetical protein LWI29_034946 [Acer saccharum]|uniref:Uncharacterized protein n=1 Tax=Acer saccharum TaxID=4024 RepID=A0AA39RS08_ACESA|nr:hypothetical protein LWI29_034946 [Acer saccharum]
MEKCGVHFMLAKHLEVLEQCAWLDNPIIKLFLTTSPITKKKKGSEEGTQLIKPPPSKEDDDVVRSSVEASVDWQQHRPWIGGGHQQLDEEMQWRPLTEEE